MPSADGSRARGALPGLSTRDGTRCGGPVFVVVTEKRPCLVRGPLYLCVAVLTVIHAIEIIGSSDKGTLLVCPLR